MDQTQDIGSSFGSCGIDEKTLARLSRHTLHDAAERGDASRMQELLALAAAEGDEEWDPSRPNNVSQTIDINARDNTLCTPLQTAILFRQLSCVEICLKHKAKLSLRCAGSPLIHLLLSMAAISGMDEENLSKERHSGRKSANEAFVEAALPMLLAAGADGSALDESGRSSLHIAASLGLTFALKLLLPEHLIPTQSTSIGNNLDQSQSLPPVQQLSKAQTALFGQINLQDNRGFTPLHTAAANKHISSFEFFMQRGADPRLIDKQGDFPMHSAVRGLSFQKDELHEILKRVAACLKLSIDELLKIENAQGKSVQAVLDESSSETSSAPFPDKERTLILTHAQCAQHHTCAPISREIGYIPPENASRLEVLLSPVFGTLRSEELAASTKLIAFAPEAKMSDVLRVHEYEYVRRILSKVGEANEDPAFPPGPVPPTEGPGSVGTIDVATGKPYPPPVRGGIRLLDADTSLSRGSWSAALRASGAVCAAIDAVVAGRVRNAFCPVRPPGHHAGPRGVVTSERDPDGSHGFCLLNNVAVGAAYAVHHYGREKFGYMSEMARGATGLSINSSTEQNSSTPTPLIRRVAIFDFDVHHGNGTEAILRNLSPNELCETIKLPFAHASVSVMSYRPWLDANDGSNVLFVSSHGYGAKRDEDAKAVGVFYPGSGASTGWDVGALSKISAEASVEASTSKGQVIPSLDFSVKETPRPTHQTSRLGSDETITPRIPSSVPPFKASLNHLPLVSLSSLATPRTALSSSSEQHVSEMNRGEEGGGGGGGGHENLHGNLLPHVLSEVQPFPPPFPSLQQIPNLQEGATPVIPEPLLEASITQPHVINVAMSHGHGPRVWRRIMTSDVLPRLAAFRPDLILISAGFDAHKSDTINCGYMRLSEEDYFWITRQLVKIANLTANGRIVSVLEGGYKVQGRVVSPFAKSVAAHVRALSSGCMIKWDTKRERDILLREMTWEAEREREKVEKDKAEKASNNPEQVERVGFESPLGKGVVDVVMSSVVATQSSDLALLNKATSVTSSVSALASSQMVDTTDMTTSSSDRRASKRRRDVPPIDYAALDAKLKEEEKEKKKSDVIQTESKQQ
jgi:acetoin utilization deacetylase AcuC-like enzyme/ankyrin repeat protein